MLLPCFSLVNMLFSCQLVLASVLSRGGLLIPELQYESWRNECTLLHRVIGYKYSKNFTAP